MQAVVLAAGRGARVMPLTGAVPKALLPIANRPLLDFVIGALEHAGISRIAIVTGHMGEKVVRYLEASRRPRSAEITYINAQKYERGSLYSLLGAESLVDEDFVLMPTDLIISQGIVFKLLANYTERNTIYAATDRLRSSLGSSLVSCQGKEGEDRKRLLGFGKVVEDRKDRLKTRIAVHASVGVVICPIEIFEHAHKTAETGATRVVDALNRYIEMSGNGLCVEISREDYWFDVDTFQTMLTANRFILDRSVELDGFVGRFYSHKTTLEAEAEVTSSSLPPSRIIGPVLIGEGCTVGRGGRIGPHVSIQEKCVIGNRVTCRNAIVLGNSKIDDDISIKDAVVFEQGIISAEKHTRAATKRDG